MSSAIPHLDFEQHSLPNGLRIVLHRDNSKPLVAVNLWYHVGSKHESPGKTGFAHLFEHMCFQGSEHVGTTDHFRYVQQVGGVANGSTWFDRTNYYDTLPAHHLDLGLWLESDRMGFLLPAVTQENLDNQRSVVMNERRQRIDNMPYGKAGESLHELLYPGDHPYRWPVIGYMEDLEAAALEDVHSFFRRFYTPSNAVLTLAGDFDPADALARIEDWFGDLPAGEPVPPVAAPLSPLGERRRVIADEVRLPRVYIAFRAPAYGQRGWYAGDLLASALAGGKSSRLYRDLVYDRQIAQDVGAYINPFEESAPFILIATARPGVSIETVERALVDQLESAATELVPADHLERARNRILTQYYSDLQKLDSRADLLSQFATYFDDPGALTRELEAYRDLSREELRDFVAGHGQEAERVTVTFVPRNGNGKGEAKG
jgi:zinc protease